MQMTQAFSRAGTAAASSVQAYAAACFLRAYFNVVAAAAPNPDSSLSAENLSEWHPSKSVAARAVEAVAGESSAAVPAGEERTSSLAAAPPTWRESSVSVKLGGRDINDGSAAETYWWWHAQQQQQQRILAFFRYPLLQQSLLQGLPPQATAWLLVLSPSFAAAAAARPPLLRLWGGSAFELCLRGLPPVLSLTALLQQQEQLLLYCQRIREDQEKRLPQQQQKNLFPQQQELYTSEPEQQQHQPQQQREQRQRSSTDLVVVLAETKKKQQQTWEHQQHLQQQQQKNKNGFPGAAAAAVDPAASWKTLIQMPPELLLALRRLTVVDSLTPLQQLLLPLLLSPSHDFFLVARMQSGKSFAVQLAFALRLYAEVQPHQQRLFQHNHCQPQRMQQHSIKPQKIKKNKTQQSPKKQLPTTIYNHHQHHHRHITKRPNNQPLNKNHLLKKQRLKQLQINIKQKQLNNTTKEQLNITEKQLNNTTKEQLNITEKQLNNTMEEQEQIQPLKKQLMKREQARALHIEEKEVDSHKRRLLTDNALVAGSMDIKVADAAFQCESAASILFHHVASKLAGIETQAPAGDTQQAASAATESARNTSATMGYTREATKTRASREARQRGHDREATTAGGSSTRGTETVVAETPDSFPLCVFLLPTRDLAMQTQQQLQRLLLYSQFRTALLIGGRSFLDAANYDLETAAAEADAAVEQEKALLRLGESPQRALLTKESCAHSSLHQSAVLRHSIISNSSWDWRSSVGTAGAAERSRRAFERLEQQKAIAWICTTGKLEEYLAFTEWRAACSHTHSSKSDSRSCEKSSSSSTSSNGSMANRKDGNFMQNQSISSCGSSLRGAECLRECKLLVVDEAVVLLREGEHHMRCLLRLKEQLAPGHQTILMSSFAPMDARALITRLMRPHSFTLNALQAQQQPEQKNSQQQQQFSYDGFQSKSNLAPPQRGLLWGPKRASEFLAKKQHEFWLQQQQLLQQQQQQPFFQSQDLDKCPMQQNVQSNSQQLERQHKPPQRQKQQSQQPPLQLQQQSQEVEKKQVCVEAAPPEDSFQGEKKGEQVEALLLASSSHHRQQQQQEQQLLRQIPLQKITDKNMQGKKKKEEETRLSEQHSGFGTSTLARNNPVCIQSFEPPRKSLGASSFSAKRDHLENERSFNGTTERQFSAQNTQKNNVHADSTVKKSDTGAVLSAAKCAAGGMTAASSCSTPSGKAVGSCQAPTTATAAAEEGGMYCSPGRRVEEYALYPAELHAHVLFNVMLREAAAVESEMMSEREASQPEIDDLASCREAATAGVRLFRAPTAAAKEEASSQHSRFCSNEPIEVSRRREDTVAAGEKPAQVRRVIFFFSCLKTLQFHYVFFKSFLLPLLRRLLLLQPSFPPAAAALATSSATTAATDIISTKEATATPAPASAGSLSSSIGAASAFVCCAGGLAKDRNCHSSAGSSNRDSCALHSTRRIEKDCARKGTSSIPNTFPPEEEPPSAASSHSSTGKNTLPAAASTSLSNNSSFSFVAAASSSQRPLTPLSGGAATKRSGRFRKTAAATADHLSAASAAAATSEAFPVVPAPPKTTSKTRIRLFALHHGLSLDKRRAAVEGFAACESTHVKFAYSNTNSNTFFHAKNSNSSSANADCDSNTHKNGRLFTKSSSFNCSSAGSGTASNAETYESILLSDDSGLHTSPQCDDSRDTCNQNGKERTSQVRDVFGSVDTSSGHDTFCSENRNGTTSSYSCSSRGQRKNFKPEVRFLFATDLAAVGLAFGQVHTIVHVGVPKSVDTYVQRVSRLQENQQTHESPTTACSTTSSISLSPPKTVAASRTTCQMEEASATALLTRAEGEERARQKPLRRKSLLLLHDLEAHFLYMCCQEEGLPFLKEMQALEALSVLQPHPALALLLHQNYTQLLSTYYYNCDSDHPQQPQPYHYQSKPPVQQPQQRPQIEQLEKKASSSKRPRSNWWNFLQQQQLLQSKQQAKKKQQAAFHLQPFYHYYVKKQQKSKRAWVAKQSQQSRLLQQKKQQQSQLLLSSEPAQGKKRSEEGQCMHYGSNIEQKTQEVGQGAAKTQCGRVCDTKKRKALRLLFSKRQQRKGRLSTKDKDHLVAGVLACGSQRKSGKAGNSVSATLAGRGERLLNSVSAAAAAFAPPLTTRPVEAKQACEGLAGSQNEGHSLVLLSAADNAATLAVQQQRSAAANFIKTTAAHATDSAAATAVLKKSPQLIALTAPVNISRRQSSAESHKNRKKSMERKLRKSEGTTAVIANELAVAVAEEDDCDDSFVRTTTLPRWEEALPPLRASAELMYRCLLGFYSMQSKTLKFEKWQVPSLVNAILTSFGLTERFAVTKQFAARLQLLNAPGLEVDYWARQRSDLLASLAAYPAYISRSREIALTGGATHAPSLALHATELKQLYLQQQQQSQAYALKHRKSGTKPNTEGAGAGDDEECKQTPVIQMSVDCLPSQTVPAEYSSIQKSVSTAAGAHSKEGNELAECAQKKEDDTEYIAWQTLWPPPLPLNMIPHGRELEKRRGKAHERQKVKKMPL